MGRLTIPYVPVNGASNLIDATSVNLNFNAIATAVNNVDNTQIGAAGIYANQVIPTNTSQATFGGSQPYTFSGALATGGPAQVVRTNGDLEVKRSSSTGLITIGGSSGYATLDYGITNSGVLTISKGLNTPASFYNTLASYSWTGDSGYSSSIGAGSTNIVAGVSGSAWNISTAASGGQFLSAQDQSGNFGIKSSLAVGTFLNAGQGIAATGGDGGFARSTTTGMIILGGLSGYATLDYGITNSGVLTISKGLNTPASFYNTAASYSWTGDSGYSSSIGAGSTNIVAGVSGSAWNISTAASGGQFLSAQDQSGNFGIKSSLAVGTSVSAQSGVFPGQAGLSLGGLYANAGVPGFSAYGGSIYIRTDGSSGARIYVNQASGTTGSSWTAIAGV